MRKRDRGASDRARFGRHLSLPAIVSDAPPIHASPGHLPEADPAGRIHRHFKLIGTATATAGQGI